MSILGWPIIEKSHNVFSEWTVVIVIILCLVVSRVPGMLGVAALQSPTPTRTKIPTAIRTPKPTKTPGPSPTPTVSLTPTATPTPFPLPFVDNFDSGYNPVWRIKGNEPFVVNGSLTSDPNNSGESWVFIGDNSWRNYQVEASMAFIYWEPVHALGVRVNGDSSMVALGFHSSGDQPRMSYIYGGVWEEIPSTRNLWVFDDGFYLILIRVEDGTITSYINSELQSKVTLPPSKAKSWETGGVGILLGKGVEVDYVKVSPLP